MNIPDEIDGLFPEGFIKRERRVPTAKDLLNKYFKKPLFACYKRGERSRLKHRLKRFLIRQVSTLVFGYKDFIKFKWSWNRAYLRNHKIYFLRSINTVNKFTRRYRDCNSLCRKAFLIEDIEDEEIQVQV